MNATPQFIGALTELVWAQIGKGSFPVMETWTLLTPYATIENISIDLETFASHAGRSTVTTADVLLLARKNPDLQQIMETYVEECKASKASK
ncbi:hypothetical protein CDD82_536 [Ophiocordyceps australis]|uniref:Centromere protein S n=1 Tax=Ophiocordyceps australis TaxID=1399860 RepID=A0A2C5YN82_9HYPO|nr:hypothetical protein CDD82_536 [Ophiocordyceps australis]